MNFVNRSDEVTRMLKLTSRYASPAEIEMMWCPLIGINLRYFRAFLPQLKVLVIVSCSFRAEFLEILATQALHLESLHIAHCNYRDDKDSHRIMTAMFSSLKFRALKKLTIHCGESVSFTDLVLPQLDELHLDINWQENDSFFEVTARRVPHIAQLTFHTNKLIHHDDIINVGRLKHLTHLSLGLFKTTICFYEDILRELNAHNIALESLHLHAPDMNSNNYCFDSLVDEIGKMSNLKNLRLMRFKRMAPHYYPRICQPLTKLTTLHIDHFDDYFVTLFRLYRRREQEGHVHSFENLLDVVRVCKSLENLNYTYERRSAITIDAKAFQKIVDALGHGRRHQLTIHYIEGDIAVNVPRKLIETCKPKLCFRSMPFNSTYDGCGLYF